MQGLCSRGVVAGTRRIPLRAVLSWGDSGETPLVSLPCGVPHGRLPVSPPGWISSKLRRYAVLSARATGVPLSEVRVPVLGGVCGHSSVGVLLQSGGAPLWAGSHPGGGVLSGALFDPRRGGGGCVHQGLC